MDSEPTKDIDVDGPRGAAAGQLSVNDDSRYAMDSMALGIRRRDGVIHVTDHDGRIRERRSSDRLDSRIAARAACTEDLDRYHGSPQDVWGGSP
jgi:hypothetical protein